ncbi:MAG: alanine dehydrogenase [Planctomycetales bacterium 4572_13]|nr:MAG: alanine dehydrogenase [Planctomycetales bacterium 4572_13]
MKIGIPKEVKVKENRVSCTPNGVHQLVKSGHKVYIEANAGQGSGFSNQQYEQAGGIIVPCAGDAWDADMVIKVKEPIEPEYKFFRKDLLLFTYLHLAAEKPLTEALCRSGVTGVAYETVQIGNRLPLLEPMSEIAGRMSTLMGCYYLAKPHGGKGVLLGGIPGVPIGNVLVIGGGTAGLNAARVAAGIGADVTLLEVDIDKMHFIDISMHGSIRTIYSNEDALLEKLPEVDLLIGAVLIPGAKAPKLIKREFLKRMRPGTVFVDIAIDQGGCAETSKATTHDAPIYFEEDILHYCVANMPGAYARTSTQALTNSTLPYAVKLANYGFEAFQRLPELYLGVNTFDGAITCEPVAQAHGMEYRKLQA